MGVAPGARVGSGVASSADAPSASSTHQGGGEAIQRPRSSPADAITFPPDVIGSLHEIAGPIFEGVLPVLAATTNTANDAVGQEFGADESY